MLRVILWAALLAGVGAGVGLGVARFSTPIFEARSALLASSTADPAGASGEALTMLNSPQLFQHAVDRATPLHPELSTKRQLTLLPSHAATEGAGGSALSVSVQSPDPRIAADVANALVDEYNRQATKSNATSLADRRAALRQQAATAKKRVDSVQKLIEALKEKSGIMNMDAAIQTAATYQATLAQQGDSDQNQLKGLQNKLADEQAKYQQMAPTTEGTVVEAPNPKLVQDTAKLSQLQAKRVELLGTWLPTSKVVADVDVEIKAQEALIAQDRLQALSVERKETDPNPARLAIAKEIAQDSAQIASLQASISEVVKAQNRQKVASMSLPADEAKMIDLQRELDIATAKYKAVSATADAVDVNGTTAQLPILRPFMLAEPPRLPIWPDNNLMVSVGAAIGLMLGVIIGVAATGRYEQYPAAQPLPSGPNLPELPTGLSAPPLPARRGESLSALASSAASPAEAYRFMVFSMLTPGEVTLRTVLFTGVTSDSLCSEAAAQFAIAMSQSGVRTLLADCNLRNHALTEAFGFKGKSGISDMLSRTMLPNSQTDLILPTAHPELYFMPSGSEIGDGLGNYPNLQITGLVQDLIERADVKVLNTPPCAVVADAPRLVKFADSVCLVASKVDRNRGLVAKAREILKRAGAAEVDVLVIDRDEAKDSFLG